MGDKVRIAIIGSGYVGLVTGACFAELGVEVVCIDRDQAKIAALNQGQIPIYEPGLADLVARNERAGRLSFSADLEASVPGCQAVFIAVGTPTRRGDGHADLSHVYSAAQQVAAVCDPHTVVVTKSTVPVGTGAAVARLIAETRPELAFEVASNPEFLREGSAINDFMRPDRVVIGTEGQHSLDILRSLYRPLYLIQTPILETTRETAELVKYATNAFLATKITFINEIADLCEAVGANVHDVARGMGLDGRIGPKFLHPGPGYGGSCFPKDTRALVHTGQDAGARVTIVESVVAANEARKTRLAARVMAACGGSVDGLCVAILGLTFKPNTDDMRESPSLSLIPALQADGARIQAYDPEGMGQARQQLPEGPAMAYCSGAYDALAGADVAVLCTEWNEFRALDVARVREAMRAPVLVDLRNVYNPDEMAAAGFAYSSVGRPRGDVAVSAEGRTGAA